MKASDIAKVLDEIAPSNLAYTGEELGFIEGTSYKTVKVIGITERPTLDVLQQALTKMVDMLIIHEPLYHSEKSFLIDKKLLEFIPNKKRKELVRKGKFSVFRYHSQWDETKGGNNDYLAKLLGIKVSEKIPYGRIGSVKLVKLEKFAEQIKKSLGCENVIVVGDTKQYVKKVAVVAGSGNSMIEIIDYVKKRGADVLVSGDIQDGRARYAKELRLAVVDAGDYFTENPGVKHLAEILRAKLKKIKVVKLDPGPPWNVV